MVYLHNYVQTYDGMNKRGKNLPKIAQENDLFTKKHDQRNLWFKPRFGQPRGMPARAKRP